jgi:hypothetical protein
VRSKIHRSVAVVSRNLTHCSDGFATFEAINQSENAARRITSTLQTNGGQAITIIASAIHDATFLDNNIHRRLKYGEAMIANESKKAPE